MLTRQRDYGDLMEEADPTSTAEINGDAGTADAAYSQQDGNVGSQPDQSQIQLQVRFDISHGFVPSPV